MDNTEKEKLLLRMGYDLARRTELDMDKEYDAGFKRGFWAAMSVVRRFQSYCPTCGWPGYTPPVVEPSECTNAWHDGREDS